MPKKLLPMLTALAIEKLKPKEKQYKVSDGNQLSLLVEPAGAKLWRLRYTFGGREKMLSLGSFPRCHLPLREMLSKSRMTNILSQQLMMLTFSMTLIVFRIARFKFLKNPRRKALIYKIISIGTHNPRPLAF
jgi:hypothetical protein